MSILGTPVGIALDRVVGEPPLAWHPVAGYGRAMLAVERRLYADHRLAGVAHLGTGLGLAVAAGVIARRALGRPASTALAVGLCAAGRMLEEEAAAMASLLREGDLAAARRRVRSLVGRDPSSLDAGELSRAVVESVAENLVDAVTATIWWGAVAGATGVFAHRAVNTLDAMVGHRDDRHARFGWASARVDDVANFLPARCTALAVAVARPRRAGTVWRVVRRDAPAHPSPNGGVVEAAFAAALGTTLGGVNRYGDTIEDRGRLGDGPPPAVSDIDAAVRLARDVTLITLAAVVSCGMVARRLRRRRR